VFLVDLVRPGYLILEFPVYLEVPENLVCQFHLNLVYLECLVYPVHPFQPNPVRLEDLEFLGYLILEFPVNPENLAYLVYLECLVHLVHQYYRCFHQYLERLVYLECLAYLEFHVRQ